MRQFGAGSPQSQVRLLSLLDSTAALVRPEEAHEASSKSVMNVLSFFLKTWTSTWIFSHFRQMCDNVTHVVTLYFQP